MNSGFLYPKPSDIIPDFHLASSESTSVRISDYRGFKNLVLVFAGDPDDKPCRRFLAWLAQHYYELIQENAEVLAIIYGSVEEAKKVKHKGNLLFPVLADEDGQAHLAVGGLTSHGKAAITIYITDRFNEIYSVYRADSGVALPSLEEMLSKLSFIEMQCPE